MYMDRVQLPPVRQQQQQGPPQPHNGANCDPALGERVPEKPEKPAGYYGKEQQYNDPAKNPYCVQQQHQQQAPPVGAVAPQPTTQDLAAVHGQVVLAWVLFGVGFILPLLWVVNIFTPLCRSPRFTKSSFIAWLLSIIFFIVYIVVIVTLIVVLNKNNNTASSGCYYDVYGTLYCQR